MKEQKNIERLFQEKFKNFEATPPQNAWKNIENKLQQKKKRRIIPFWLKASGIAASLTLGFLLFKGSFFNTLELNKNSNPKNINIKPTNSTVKISDVETNKSNNKPKDINIRPSNSIAIISNDKTNNELNKNLEKPSLDNNMSEKYTNKKSNNIKLKSIDNNRFSTISYVSGITNYTQSSSNEDKKDKTLTVNERILEQPLLQNNFQKDINQSKLVFNEKIENRITQDSSIVAQISKEINALEQLLNEKNVGINADEKEKENKWGVSTHLAPIYFNSLTKGSSLSSQFVENEKSYASTLSYGVGVEYDITKKLSVRTGFNNLALDYNTNDVAYSSSMDGNINDDVALRRNANGEKVVFSNKNAINALSSDIENVTLENKGILNQKTTYFEIPVEFSYKLLDKKVSIALIGGMSTLFLNENSISLLSNGMEMNIGEANNLNEIHFSGNFGFGFKYSFLKNLEANFNPMYKYQINNYSNNIENFKPYVFGLYTGVLYKF